MTNVKIPVADLRRVILSLFSLANIRQLRVQVEHFDANTTLQAARREGRVTWWPSVPLDYPEVLWRLPSLKPVGVCLSVIDETGHALQSVTFLSSDLA